MSNLKDKLTAEEWQQLEKEIEEEKESLAASAKAATIELKEMNTKFNEAYFKSMNGAALPSLVRSVKGLLESVEAGQMSKLHFYENLKVFVRIIEKKFGY